MAPSNRSDAMASSLLRRRHEGFVASLFAVAAMALCTANEGACSSDNGGAGGAGGAQVASTGFEDPPLHDMMCISWPKPGLCPTGDVITSTSQSGAGGAAGGGGESATDADGGLECPGIYDVQKCLMHCGSATITGQAEYNGGQ